MVSPKTDAVVAMREDGEYNRHSDLQLRLIRIGLEHGIDTPKSNRLSLPATMFSTNTI